VVILAILNVGIACLRVVVTVGVNVPIISGKEIGITSVSWNCGEVKNQIHCCVNGWI
jgi:hypothetical protein